MPTLLCTKYKYSRDDAYLDLKVFEMNIVIVRVLKISNIACLFYMPK
jgi:hypothetical protein